MTYDFTRIAYLGDSLTDDGNLYALTERLFGFGLPLSPPYDKAATNGDTHAETLSDLLGLSGDLNFAVGGAKAGDDRTLQDYLGDNALLDTLSGTLSADQQDALATVIDLSGQTQRLLEATAGTDRSDLAVALLIGANDLNIPLDGYTPEGALAKITAALDGIAAATATLLAAGVGEVLLYTLPGGSFFPTVSMQGAEADAVGDQVSAFFNSGILSIADSFAESVRVIEFGLLGDEVAADATGFGFRNSEDYAFSGSGGLPVPTLDYFTTPEEQFMFWDEVHPTEEFHDILAIFEAETLTHGLTKGSDGADVETYGNDAEFVFALGGDDDLLLRGGDDVVLAGYGNDTVAGERGSDLIGGGKGNDLIDGNRDSDLLAGNDGNDTLRGGGGNDILIDGNGSNRVFGGSGNDLFIFTEEELFGRDSNDTDILNGGRGFDTLVLRLTATTKALADLDRFFWGDGSAVFDDLGLNVSSIERYVFVGRDETPDLSLNGDQTALLEQAELWNFI
ncbi:SGNH/GDSL hydrolase family protein [Litorisediminicola beolgyonensis]|uniref:SGNH/GDSL hydrolase family protein n=1 Tax=Litorisediminicola beolgyonensis TaxID=1173614 RepID=A0ABW3ZEY1_9RHOB